jgi:hypothetical protein
MDLYYKAGLDLSKLLSSDEDAEAQLEKTIKDYGLSQYHM